MKEPRRNPWQWNTTSSKEGINFSFWKNSRRGNLWRGSQLIRLEDRKKQKSALKSNKISRKMGRHTLQWREGKGAIGRIKETFWLSLQMKWRRLQSRRISMLSTTTSDPWPKNTMGTTELKISQEHHSKLTDEEQMKNKNNRWRGGLSTSRICWINHPATKTKMQSSRLIPDHHQQERLKSYHATKHQVLTIYLQKLLNRSSNTNARWTAL